MVKRKKPKKAKAPQKPLHYFVAVQDREAWGSSTLCGAKGAGTFDHNSVACEDCMTYTDYDEASYQSLYGTPLTFCTHCDGGLRRLKASTGSNYQIGCSRCDHLEWCKR